MDSSGKVYIAVSSDNTVRVVTTDGLINIFAGSGYQGWYGDYSRHHQRDARHRREPRTATLAGLTNPQDVALGPNNSILIAEPVTARFAR